MTDTAGCPGCFQRHLPNETTAECWARMDRRITRACQLAADWYSVAVAGHKHTGLPDGAST